jgi:nucleoside-diphosphate-sugar epimerase
VKIFVTGASGYLGSAVARAFKAAGHEVDGTRVPLGDAKQLRERALGADAVAHVALAPNGPDRVALDLRAIEALSSAKRWIYTSGTWALGTTDGAGEDAPTDRPATYSAWRPSHEKAALEAGAIVIRPGMVFGGAGGSVADMFQPALDEKVVRFVGDGKNRWPMVHRDDNAALYLRAIERGASGILHAANESVRVAEIAQAVLRVTGARTVEGRRPESSYDEALCLDQVMLCPRSRELGWKPAHPPFVECAPAMLSEYQQER